VQLLEPVTSTAQANAAQRPVERLRDTIGDWQSPFHEQGAGYGREFEHQLVADSSTSR
jgi:hypothetical protein